MEYYSVVVTNFKRLHCVVHIMWAVLGAAGSIAEPQRRLCGRKVASGIIHILREGDGAEKSAGVARRPRALTLSNLPTHRK